jgi:thioesterase domain-containing protein
MNLNFSDSIEARELLQDLIRRGVVLSADGERLRVNAPRGAITAAMQAVISDKKADLLFLLNQTPARLDSESIRQLSREQPHPLSISQERLWEMMQIAGSSPLYNMYLAFRLCGDLDTSGLEKSLQSLIERHEPLRTQFSIQQGTPVQRVQIFSGWSLPVTDLTGHHNPENGLADIIKREAAHHFELINDRLFRAQLIRLNDAEHVLILVMHHLISDGWSWEVFLRELSHLYSAYQRGETADLTPLPVQYLEFSAWQRDFVSSATYATQLAEWERALNGISPLELPADVAHGSSLNFSGSRVEFVFAPGFGQLLRKFSKERNVTLFMTLLAAFNATLHQITGQTDLLLGSPVAARDRLEFQTIMGYFNNIIPLRAVISGGDTFSSVLANMREVVSSIYDKADVPVHRIAGIPALGHISLTRAVFAVQEGSGQTLSLQGLEVVPLPAYNETANFDLFLTAQIRGTDLHLIAEYRSSLFRRETISNFLHDYAALMIAALNAPEQSIKELLPDPRTKMADRILVDVVDNQTEPSSPVEIKLVTLWEEMFKRHPIGVLDNFFDLGGHSMLALHLFGRIQKEFDIQLPLATLLKEPTIRYLATLIESGDTHISWESMVAIQPHGSRPPFFGMHGIDGNILFWRNIALHLGTEQPFFGLQARGMDGRSRAFDSIPQMAAAYLEEIRQIQPHGPYHLGGYSLGGEIAFEMAQQLNRQGEQVGLLVMFDTSNPIRAIRTDVLDNKKIESPSESNLQQRLRIWKRKFNGHLQRLQTLTLRQQAAYLMGDAIMRFDRLQLYATVNILHRLGKRLSAKMLLKYILEMHLKAVNNYIPEIYPGQITIFRASESLAENPPDSPMGWGPLAKQGINLKVFDGNHADVYAPEQAPNIAEMLRSCLSQ